MISSQWSAQSYPRQWHRIVLVAVAAGALLAGSGCYVVLEAETELSIESRYGCRLLAWADGPAQWLDGATRGDLYGH